MIHTVCWTRGPAGMAKSLSQDLRSRLISAVAGGMSRRAAAERFGVSAASAVRWVRAWRETGRRAAKRQGGDRRSERIEAYRSVILDAIDTRADITLGEIAEMLRREHGATFAPSTVWRFLDRHAMTVKKKRRTQPSRTGPTSPRGARPGWTPGLSSIQPVSSSSMRPALRRRWRASMAAPNAASAVAQPFHTGIGRPPPLPVRCAVRA